MRNWIKGHFFTICTTAFEHIMKLYKISPGLTVDSVKIPAKRSQHFRRKYHNIVGHKMLRAFGQQQTACPNISQQGCQTRATCCAQRWCNKLCWCTCIAIVWSGFVITLSGSKDEEVVSLQLTIKVRIFLEFFFILHHRSLAAIVQNICQSAQIFGWFVFQLSVSSNCIKSTINLHI